MKKSSIMATSSSLPRRILKVVFAIVGFAVLIKFLVWLLAPKGYSGGDCMTPLYEIRKSENLVAIFAAVAKQQNFTWWLEYGALLGTIRGGSLMPHDKDIDAAFMYHDIEKLYAMDNHLEMYGIQRFGLTFVFAEDYATMAQPGGGEKVTSKLEFYGIVVTEDDHIVREDLLEYLDQNRLAKKTIGQRIWWVLLRWTGVTFHDRTTIHPLTTAPLKRYLPPTTEIYQKMKKKLPPKKNGKSGQLELFEVDEEDEEAIKEWVIDVPVPANARKALEEVYGPSWSKEIKWRVDCYI